MTGIRIIIADDDPAFTKELSEALEGMGVEVVATVGGISDARVRARMFSPQAMLLGFAKTPRHYVLDGLRFITESVKVPVVGLCSDLASMRELRSAGAKECVLRPRVGDAALRAFAADLTAKLKAVLNHANANARQSSSTLARVFAPGRPFSTRFTGIVALGASAGGTEATANVLSRLPANIPAMIITQHIPPVFSRIYAERLDNTCAVRVVEAAPEQIAMPGTVYVAPGDKHLRLAKKDGRYHIYCTAGPKVSGHCPSVDVMFDSVAEIAGKDAVGIILTGMGRDGAEGLLKMRKRGCFTIGQDESTSVVYGMPKEAYNLGAVAHQDKLENIPGVLLSHLAKL